MEDFICDNNFDLVIKNGDFEVGDGDADDICIIAKLSPGQLSSDPILGAGLIRFIKGKFKISSIERQLLLHLKRDNKDITTLKKFINFKLK